MANGRKGVHRTRRCPWSKRVPLAALRDSLIDPGPSPERFCELSFLRDAVEQVLKRLNMRQRQVVALYVGLPGPDGLNPAGYSYYSEEIARILKRTSYGTCGAWHCAVARLRQSSEFRRLLLPFWQSLT